MTRATRKFSHPSSVRISRTVPEPDIADPPTWFYHVAVNGYDTHRGSVASCRTCPTLKPLRIPILARRSLSAAEAMRLIEAGWRKCTACSAGLGSRNVKGYCSKCWPAKKKELDALTWEDIQ